MLERDFPSVGALYEPIALVQHLSAGPWATRFQARREKKDPGRRDRREHLLVRTRVGAVHACAHALLTHPGALAQVQLHYVPGHWMVTASATAPPGEGLRQVLCFDSFENFGACVLAPLGAPLSCLQLQVADVYGSDSVMILAACPQQPEGSNACAAYACLFAWTLCNYGLVNGQAILAEWAAVHGATEAASNEHERSVRRWLALCLSNGTLPTWQERMRPVVLNAPMPPELERHLRGEQERNVAVFRQSHTLNFSAPSPVALARLKKWELENRMRTQQTCSFAFVPFCAAVEGKLPRGHNLTRTRQSESYWVSSRTGKPCSDADAWMLIQPAWALLVSVARTRWVDELVWKEDYCDAEQQLRLLDAVSQGYGVIDVKGILSSWASEFRGRAIKDETACAHAQASAVKPPIQRARAGSVAAAGADTSSSGFLARLRPRAPAQARAFM